MVNGSHNPAAFGRYPAAAGHARARLINRGQDTQLTFSDGSTIVMKGVRRVDTAFFGSGAATDLALPPLRGKIRGDR